MDEWEKVKGSLLLALLACLSFAVMGELEYIQIFGLSLLATLLIGLALMPLYFQLQRRRNPRLYQAWVFHVILKREFGIDSLYRISLLDELQLLCLCSLETVQAKLTEITKAFKCHVRLTTTEAGEPLLTVHEPPPARRRKEQRTKRLSSLEPV